MANEPWLETASGLQFQFLSPQPEQIDPFDIALALSRACRYGGHTTRFYSVAEHACHMADWVLRQPWGDEEKALTALHHDDSEAYIGDLPSPIKRHMSQFKEAEDRIDAAVAERFGTEYPHPKWLKWVDTCILLDERAQVMRKSGNVWGVDEFSELYQPLGIRLWNVLGRFPAWAEREWLWRHFDLTAKIEGTWLPTNL